MNSIIDQLNSNQKLAIEDSSKVVLVKAGPGTGKTFTLIAKISRLLESGVTPDMITAVTFTRRAAQEIKDRLKISSPDSLKHLNLGTFHSLAIKLLKLDTDRVLTAEQQRHLAQQVLFEHNSNQKLRDFLRNISIVKNSDQPIILSSSQQDLIKAYNQKLKVLNKLDFDDLLLSFLEHIDTQDFKVKYLLVDEFQDVSPTQYNLCSSWLKNLKQLFVIGDPHQAIYGFRGATEASFSQLKEEHSNVSEHLLTQNYRNPKVILETAQLLFPKDKSLESISGKKGEAAKVITLNQYYEADWVISNIEQKLGGLGLVQASDYHEAADVSLSDIAIVYRIHQLGKVVADKLTELGLPFQQVGQNSIYVQPEIELVILFWKLLALTNSNQDATAQVWEKLIINKKTNLSSKAYLKLIQFKQTLKAGWSETVDTIIGQKILDKSQEKKLSSLSLAWRKIKQLDVKSSLTQLLEATQQILVQAGLLEIEANNSWSLFRVELLQFNEQTVPLTDFLKYLTDLEEHEYYDQDGEKITLLTMHAAKGLEFSWVYLLGFEQGLVPMEKKDSTSIYSSVSDNEEKNLFYVSLTRAKKGCYLLSPQMRWGKKTQESEFWSLISPGPVDQIDDENLIKYKQKQRKKAEKDRQSSLF